MGAIIPNVISFPLGGVNEHGRLLYADEDLSVREVIRNILLTSPGERLLRPEFGAGILDFIHQPNNETTRTVLANVVRKSIEQWETRVKVDDVSIEPDPNILTQIQIVIRYQMRHSPRPMQLSVGIDLASI